VQHAVTQATVADSQRCLAQFFHDHLYDARAGEDDFGALCLQSDDRTALRLIARPVELDLAIDLGAIEDSALYDVRVVRSARSSWSGRFVTWISTASIPAKMESSWSARALAFIHAFLPE
jgi:hypothetical protein